MKPAASHFHVGAAALIQCDRNGRALAQIINFIAEQKNRSPEWLQAFDEELDHHGLQLIRDLDANATKLIEGGRIA